MNVVVGTVVVVLCSLIVRLLVIQCVQGTCVSLDITLRTPISFVPSYHYTHRSIITASSILKDFELSIILGDF